MKYDISILIPGIRTNLWKKVYDSIALSFSGSWEVIFVGPTYPDNLAEMPNAKFLQSFASPLVCRQQALIYASGTWLCWAADDVWFCEGALDKAFASLQGKDYKTFVAGKYAEGIDKNPTNIEMVNNEAYWTLNHHGFLQNTMKVFPKDYFLINTGLVSHELMIEIGGFDCQFEACAMGCCDISLRLQIHGAKGILQKDPIFHSSHLVGQEGDHGPIHDAQINHDMPLFVQLWEGKEYSHRVCIDINNHLRQPERWERRFGQAVPV